MLDEEDKTGPPRGDGVDEATLDLIESTYQSIIDPSMFVDMLDSWASKISQLGPEGAVRLNANLERRLESAMPLLQRASEEQLSEDDLVHMVLSENKPCLALSTNGVIIAANDPAASVMGLGEGDRFERDALDAKGWAVYQQFLGMIREAADAGRHCVLKFAMEDGGSLLIDAQAVTFMDTKRTFLLMKGFQLSLTDQARDILRDAFELTGTEIAIVDGLMQGQDAGEIAEARATSVETVRTQIKSIREKTETRSQMELVRMVSGLSSLDEQVQGGRVGTGARRAYRRPRHHHLMTLPNGAQIEYVRLGRKSGRPVVVLHAALFGFDWPRAAVDRIVDAGYALYFPVRPGYGESTPAGGAKTLVEEVENIRLFIDAIGLEDLSIIGQGLASAHAMALSIPIQNRVRCVIGVAGYLPVDLSQMFADMSPWQRAVLHAARFSPKLMKVYNQIGMKMMRRIGPQEFFRRTYSTSPADQAVADDPDSLALLQISYNLLQAQTSLALTTDFQHVMRNWRPVFEKVRTPVVMIHGDERQVLAPSEVEAFCDAHGHMQMLPLPGAGQLIAYSHPEKLAELVLDTLDARY
jgi:pimeloyl-ACP methyl ester carboxylesterase/DNA-binding CsgD family transcriptional regulator